MSETSREDQKDNGRQQSQSVDEAMNKMDPRLRKEEEFFVARPNRPNTLPSPLRGASEAPARFQQLLGN